jgi:hypothetical protein
MQPIITKLDQKLRFMFATRMEKSYAEAVDRLLAHHGGLQFSKYLRGLIYVDAVRSGVSTAELDRPSWVARSYPDLFDGRALSRAAKQKGQTARRRTRED